MKEAIVNRALKLLCVKSIATIVLTAVFAWLSVRGDVSSEQFLTVYTVVIAFYFGTQARKNEEATENK